MLETRHEAIQMLLDQPRGAGLVVSCYADTSVSEGNGRHWLARLKAESTRLRSILAVQPTAVDEFERQMQAIRSALDSSEARHARGMAVFCATGWDRAMAMEFDEAFEPQLVVDEEPYLVPLLLADYRCREYLVFLIDSESAALYAATPGTASLIDHLRSQEPAGTTPANRENHVLHFQKRLCQWLESAWHAHRYQGIILLGEHEFLESLRKRLPKQLASRIVCEASRGWSSTQHQICDKVGAVAADMISAEQGRLLEELGRRIKQGFAVATGPQEVVDNLRDGQVAQVLIGPDRGEVASRCKDCRSVFAFGTMTCPYCKGRCARVNLWQEILSLAVRQGTAVHFVPAATSADVPGGVAALLARDEPQWASAPPATGSAPNAVN